MAALKRAVVDAALGKVEIVYLDGATARWWNSRRNQRDTAVFSGWYWIRGVDEGGPFKTYSAAARDAYYRHVMHREPPMAAHSIARAKAAPKGRRQASRQAVAP